MRCYLSEAITILKKEERKGLTDKFLQIYNYIESYLTNNYNVEVFNPVKQRQDLTPYEIYWRDIKEVRRADFVVAEVSIVSWGVGEELMYAIMKGKPVLALYNRNSPYPLSEMVIGSGIRLRKYSDKNWKEDIIRHLAEFMTELKTLLKLRKKLVPPML